MSYFFLLGHTMHPVTPQLEISDLQGALPVQTIAGKCVAEGYEDHQHLSFILQWALEAMSWRRVCSSYSQKTDLAMRGWPAGS